ncbi:MAG: hypothetical protein EXS36_19665 [Pedosphaera sp.]|nr:hypothetical protein [Pedosphaera sp.]
MRFHSKPTGEDRAPGPGGSLTPRQGATTREWSDRTRTLSRLITFLLLVEVMIPASMAEEPSVSYIFPAGGQRGQRVQFKVGGLYLHGGAAFEMLGTGVTATSRIYKTNTVWFEGPVIPLPASQQAEDYPKDYVGSVTIEAGATPGPRSWRIGNSQGVTAARPFIIGDLPEIVEQEMDGSPIPVRIEVPVTINGRIFPREDVDIWTISARAGEEYVCDVQARRIGSPLEARLEVVDAQGKRLAEAITSTTRETQLSFTAPSDGLYQVRIHDINFGGLQNYIYRLSITRGPIVQSVFPLGGRSGTKTLFQLSGAALPANSAWLDLRTKGSPVAARFAFDHQLTNPVRIEVDNLPEYLERDPQQKSLPQATVDIPAVLNGRIGVPGDVDEWPFRARKDQQLELDLRARRLGSPLNPVLTLLDASGRELAKNDDLSDEETDSRLTFKVPADGTYLARVEERYVGRGGTRFSYRLRIAPPALPDFAVKLGSNALNVVRAEVGLTEEQRKKRPAPKPAALRIDAERTGGFNGEIEFVIEGLPKGVSVKGGKIAENQDRTELVFTAASETTIGISHLTIRARAKLGGVAVERLAHWPGDVTQDPLDDFALAVAIPTPFRVYADYLLAYGQRGSLFRRHFFIDRGGLNGVLTAGLADRQFRHLQGVVGPSVEIPANRTEFEYHVSLPPWMEIGRTSRSAVMVAGIVKDGDGSEHEVCFSSAEQNEQIIAVVAEGLMRVDADRRSILVEPNGDTEVRIKVQRDKSILDKEIALELVLPAHFRGVTALPSKVAPGETEATLKLQFANNRSLFNMAAIVRATTIDLHDPQVAETSIDLVTHE